LNCKHEINYSIKCKKKNNLFCGVDISRDFLDYAICNEEYKSIIALEKIPNDRKGIKKFN